MHGGTRSEIFRKRKDVATSCCLKEKSMARKPLALFAFILLLLGLSGLFRFSQNVRSLDVVGLFFGGVASGASLVGFVSAIRKKSKAD